MTPTLPQRLAQWRRLRFEAHVEHLAILSQAWAEAGPGVGPNERKQKAAALLQISVRKFWRDLAKARREAVDLAKSLGIEYAPPTLGAADEPHD